MGIIFRQGIKNNIITYVGVLLGFLSILVIQPIVLKPDELGLLRLLFSVSALFASMYPLGLNSFTLKYFPYIKNHEQGHHGYLGFLLITSLVLFTIGAFVLYFFQPMIIAKYPDSAAFVEQFNYVYPLSFFLGLFSMLSSYSSALYKTTFPSFLNDIFYRVLIISVLGLYYMKFISFDVVIFVYVFAYLFLVVAVFVYLTRTDVVRVRVNWGVFKTINIREAVRFTVVMSIVTVSSLSLRSIDAVFIGSYLNLTAVAVYTVSWTVASMIDVPGTSLSKIVVPQMSEAFKNGHHEQAKSIYYQTNRFCVLAGAFLFLCVYTNAHSILALLPAKYAEGEWVMRICAFGSFVNMMFGLNTNILQLSKYYFTGYMVVVALAVLSAGSNIILIPRFGIEGAAMSTALSLIVINITSFLYVRKHFGFQPFKKADGVVILITLLIAGADHFIPEISVSILSIAIKSIFICAVFGIILWKLNLGKRLSEVMSISFFLPAKKK